MTWTAEITNDPSRDFDLYIEILRDDEFIARLQYAPDGQLELQVYGERASIPFDWLRGLADRYESEVPRPGSKDAE